MNELNFDDLAPIEVPFTFKGRKYVLREAPEAAAVKYRNAYARNAKMVDGKMEASLAGMADIPPALVAGCCWELLCDKSGTPNGQERSVAEPTVLSWPSQMVKKLYEKAKEISPALEEKARDIDEQIADAEKELARLLKVKAEGDGSKNSPAPMTDTSA